MGDHFETGELLIQLDDTIFQATFARALAMLERAKAELAAKKSLFADKIASLFELRDAEASLAKARADLVIARKNLRASSILAPYTGKVVTLFIEEHELPQSNKELMEIIDDHTLIAKLLVPSSLLGKVQVGQALPIHIQEIAATVEATITRIGAVIDPASSTIRIDAEVDNADGYLKAGMIGSTTFAEQPTQGKEQTNKATSTNTLDKLIAPMRLPKRPNIRQE